MLMLFMEVSIEDIHVLFKGKENYRTYAGSGPCLCHYTLRFVFEIGQYSRAGYDGATKLIIFFCCGLPKPSLEGRTEHQITKNQALINL